MFHTSKLRGIVWIALLGLALTGCLGGSSANPGGNTVPKPTYKVEGVKDGSTYDHPVTPKITPGPGTTLKELTLNGNPFNTGTQIVESGTYELEVVVQNTKGEEALGKITFTLLLEIGTPVIRVPEQYESIQDAIDASWDGYTIVVAPGTYTENLNTRGKNITLRSTNPMDSDIVSSTIIAGNKEDSVIRIENGETDVVITGFTITLGSGKVEVDGNTYGGGIYVRDAAATISRNLIEGNGLSVSNKFCKSGGGIYIVRSDSLSDPYMFTSKIEDNIISNNWASSYGGGLCVMSGAHIIADNVLSQNSAYQGGGGYMGDGAHTITGNIVSENRSLLSGGGLHLEGGAHTITGNTVRDNKSSAGGGLYLASGAHAITGNNIPNNEASQYGGGIYVKSGVHTIADNVFSHNSASQGGGGLLLADGTHIIMSNTINNNRSPAGAGISILSGRHTISYNTVNNNTGGGLLLGGDDNMITYNTITENEATAGGGIYVIGGKHSITDNTVSNNTASVRGGGFYLSGGTLTISGNIISANTASDAGGGMYISLGTHSITGNAVSQNTASKAGGGLYVFGGKHVITNNTVSENSSVIDGGGMYISGNDGYRSVVNLTNNSLGSNSAGGKGGAVWVGLWSSVTDAHGNALSKPDTFNEYIGNTPDDIYYE